jgi:hypothetical protein
VNNKSQERIHWLVDSIRQDVRLLCRLVAVIIVIESLVAFTLLLVSTPVVN